MLFQGWLVIRRLGFATKFEISMFTLYDDMKGNAKFRNWDSLRG